MSPDKKHGREAAHRRAAAASAAREASRRRQRRMRSVIGGVVAIGVVLAVVLAAFPNSGHKTATATTTTTARSGGVFAYGTGACPPESKPATKPTSFAEAPRKCIKDGVDYRANVVTTQGAFTIDLLESSAPGTVNNFVVLARWGWFDGQPFGRVVPGFVNQEGVPTGKGPGYTIPDELPPSLSSYVKWSVAMANTGQPHTGGDAWFTCIDCSKLPSPDYSRFGLITSGTDVAQKINDLGVGDGPPKTPVTITSVTIVES